MGIEARLDRETYRRIRSNIIVDLLPLVWNKQLFLLPDSDDNCSLPTISVSAPPELIGAIYIGMLTERVFAYVRWWTIFRLLFQSRKFRTKLLLPGGGLAYFLKKFSETYPLNYSDVWMEMSTPDLRDRFTTGPAFFTDSKVFISSYSPSRVVPVFASLQAFSKQIWLTLAAAILIVSFVLSIATKIENDLLLGNSNPGYLSSLWRTTFTALNKGFPNAPKLQGGRILSAFWLLLVFVLSCEYLGNLTTSFTDYKCSNIEKLEDVLKKDNLKVYLSELEFRGKAFSMINDEVNTRGITWNKLYTLKKGPIMICAGFKALIPSEVECDSTFGNPADQMDPKKDLSINRIFFMRNLLDGNAVIVGEENTLYARITDISFMDPKEGHHELKGHTEEIQKRIPSLRLFKSSKVYLSLQVMLLVRKSLPMELRELLFTRSSMLLEGGHLNYLEELYRVHKPTRVFEKCQKGKENSAINITDMFPIFVIFLCGLSLSIITILSEFVFSKFNL